MNDGANWDEDQKACWMTDAPLSEWHGVTADEDDNVTELELSRYQLAGLSCLNDMPPFDF